jgi:formate transporter
MAQHFATFRFIANMILAGCSVSMGAYAYLQAPGLIGSVLFIAGLLPVYYYHLNLYTDIVRAINLKVPMDYVCLLVILAANIFGCLLSSLLVTDAATILACQEIVTARAEVGFWESIVNGAGCGFIMTLISQNWKKNKLCLLIGVPAFILSGFTHSVAESFFFYVGWDVVTAANTLAMFGVIIGNFIGGLIYRIGTAPLRRK